MRAKYWRLIPLLLFFLSGFSQAATRPLDGIEEQIEKAMREYHAPGLAVGVVKDGELVFAKGFGVTRLGGGKPVDTRTVFAIASCTKAFTTAALSILADEGKLSWDDHVVDRLPSFQLYDPYVTRELRIRDLVTHRSGLSLGAGDLLFFPPTDFTQEEIVQRLRFIKPADGLRYRYAYSNLMYLVAGKVIEAVSGKTWGEFIRERIFQPVGMTGSSTSVAELRASPLAATPHAKVNGEHRPVEPGPLDNCAPAGAINSNIEDLSKWVRVQLAQGALPEAGKRLFSEAAAREMHSMQIALPVSAPPPSLPPLRANFSGYGLGWSIRDYRGQKLVAHNGGLLGFLTRIVLVPELKLGVIILENGASGVMTPLSFVLLDRYLGAEPAFDWVGAYKTFGEQRERDARKADEKQRNADSKPSLPLERYAGTYSDAWRGEVSIRYESGKLVMRFSHTNSLVADLEHWQYDSFIARWRDRSLDADAYVTFSLNPDGGIREARMRPVSQLTDFSFDFQDLLLVPSKPTKPSGK